jgi:hypothetical protein
MATGEMPQGRFIIGRFGRVKQVTKRNGDEVPGLFEVELSVDGREWPLRASYFRTDQDGEVTKMHRSIESVQPESGQLVCVAISTRATNKAEKAYVNDTALVLYSLAGPKAGANGSKSAVA